MEKVKIKILRIAFFLMILISVSMISMIFSMPKGFSAELIKKKPHFDAVVLPLKFLIKKALKNPEIKSSIYQYLGYKENITIVKSLPEPAVGFGMTDANGFNNPQIGINSMSYWKFSASQAIPFPTKLFINSKIKKSIYKSLKDKTISLKLFTILNIKDVYYNLALLEKDIKTFKENLTLINLLLKYADRNYASGRSNARGPMRIILEIDQIKTKLILFKKQKNKFVYILSKFTELPIKYFKNKKAEFMGKVMPLKYQFNNLMKTADKLNPDLKEGKENIKTSLLGIDLANQGYYPNFSVFLGYGDRYSLQPVISGGVSITLPLYFNESQIPKINKAKKYNINTIYKYAWIRLKTVQDLKTAVSNIKNDYKVYVINKNITEPEAKLLFNSYTKSLMSGKAQTFPLLNSFVQLLLIRLKTYAYKAEYFKDDAFLEAVIGKN
ncbi:MAG: TolC family protein [Deltaproteobacteria bacterium]|nr:TolC family protein [Deltaproteobacteria bacterium]